MPEGKNKNAFPPVKPGMVFGYLEVIGKADPYRPPGGGKPTARWKCRCKLCGTEITLTANALHIRKNKSCGCTDIGTKKPKPSVTPGMVFGELEVKERAPDHFTPSGIKKPCWVCECSCGVRVTVQQQVLVQGRKWHCGCKRGAAPGGGKQGNRYDLTGAYGIGYTNKGEPFWFDLEDYQKIKGYTWYYDRDGYTKANVKGQNPVPLHQLVMPEPPEGMVIDHKEHPPGRLAKRIDNRKSNLRFATIGQNCQNRCLRRDNTSGVTGIYEHNGRWVAHIKRNGKRTEKHFPLTDEGFENAKAWRREKELEIFGDFQYSGSIMQAPLPDAPKQPAQSAGQGPKEGAIGVYKTNSAWVASIQRKRVSYKKRFPLTDEGFKDACAWREETRKALERGQTPDEPLNCKKYSRALPKGVSKNTGRYYAHIMRKGKLYSKSFPGTDEGLREAVEWRKGMEEKLK